MGWDAWIDIPKDDWKMKAKIELSFAAAAGWFKRRGEIRDGFLSIGGLDCSPCRWALEAATDRSCHPESSWDAKLVKRLAEDAVWEGDRFNDVAPWAVKSARKFLELCAKHGRGINFT